MDVSVGSDSAHMSVGNELLDSGKMRTIWVCEKWSEEAVEFARSRLLRIGVTHLLDGLKMVPVKLAVTSEVLRQIVGAPEVVEERYGNLLLNEGIQELWDILIAAGGTTLYDNTNAQLGVGDSATGELATHQDLQAATNKLFKAMVATYPQRTNQTVAFRSDFTSGEANWVWNEWSVRNGATRDKNLNRKVESLGTKSTGTWTLTGSLTLS